MDFSDDQLSQISRASDPPEGDVVVAVESHDRNLLRELWTLEGGGIEVSQTVQKSGPDPSIVYLVLRDAEASVKGTLPVLAGVFLQKALNLIHSLSGGDKKHSKTKIRSRKFSVEVKGFALRYEDSVDVEVEQAEDEKEDAPKE